jgi:hypothetical protein
MQVYREFLQERMTRNLRSISLIKFLIILVYTQLRTLWQEIQLKWFVKESYHAHQNWTV